jgi:hypothetical protein
MPRSRNSANPWPDKLKRERLSFVKISYACAAHSFLPSKPHLLRYPSHLCRDFDNQDSRKIVGSCTARKNDHRATTDRTRKIGPTISYCFIEKLLGSVQTSSAFASLQPSSPSNAFEQCATWQHVLALLPLLPLLPRPLPTTHSDQMEHHP